MPPATIQLLGDVSITRPGGSGAVLGRQQPRTVAALLVTERHRGVSRSEIADVLWEDELPAHWAGAVRGVVSKVRSFLDEAGAGDWLVTTGEGWRLDVPDDVTVDVEEAAAIVEAAHAALRADADDEAWSARTDELTWVDQAVSGELAPGARGAWIEQRRGECERLRRRGLSALVACARRAGRLDAAVPAAQTLARIDPYSDEAARLLVGALADAGDRPGALAAATAFGQLLHDDLGMRPEPETEALTRALRGLAPLTPVGIGGHTSGALVGRADEMAVLAAAWDDVVSGAGARAVLLTGEAGAGKSRLAAEAAAMVTQGRVLWGRCSPEARTSFEPVVEALARTLHEDPSPLGALGSLTGELAPVLPELVSGPDDRSAVRPSDRSQLFRAMTAAVRATVTAPSVWVVDDLQWANDDTIALLTHLVGALADIDVLVVFTSRGHGRDAAEMLAAAARSIPLTTVPVDGLGRDAVTDLLLAAGVADAEDIGELVRGRTGGNPFFIQELVRSVDDDGRLDPLTLPVTLRSWIDQRVAALEAPVAQALSGAAVLGANVDVGVLAAMTGSDDLTMSIHCAALVGDGLLVEVQAASDAGADLAFAHALTRDAVYEGIGGLQRRVLHQRAAEALRAMRPDGSSTQLARHLAAAGPAVDVAAVDAMLTAGEHALAQTAWVAARDWFDEVLARRLDRGVDRIRALIGSGIARRGLALRDEARAALSEALDHARALGEARLGAQATLGLVGGGARGVSEAMSDADRGDLLAQALDRLGPDDDDLAIPVELELALALLLTERDDERVKLAVDALDRARRLGRADLLGSALLGARVARHGPEHAEARLSDVDEVLAMDRSTRSHAVTVGALMARHEDALLIGDRVLAREALAEASEVVEQSGHPYWRWVVETWRTLDLIIDGHLDRAEAHAFEALQLQGEHPEALACVGVNLVDIRLFQGRADEMIELLTSAADENPQIPAYRAVLSLCRAESGQVAEAAAAYRIFAADSFTSVPDDTNRLLTLAVLADVAATLGDEPGASALLDLLTPHGARHVILNCFAGGGAYWGQVATQLGRLATVLGDDAAAVEWFGQARISAQSFGAPRALARIPDVN